MASAAPAGPAAPKLVAVVANPSTSEVLGPIGFWLSELAHPYFELSKHGYTIDIASPNGGEAKFDGMSDPESPKAPAVDLVSTGFKHHPKTSALLQNTIPLKNIKSSDYDGIIIIGGLSPMKTFDSNEELHRLFAEFYEAGKLSATICHGSCILLKAKLSSGKLLAEGKRWTGFSDTEEGILNKTLGKTLQPWTIETEAKKLPTSYVASAPFKPFAVADGNLISGQQGSSGFALAGEILKFFAANPPKH